MARSPNEGSWASSPGRRRNMQANRSQDTQPELAVRRRLHGEGLRYRIAVAPVPGLRRRADIVFTRARIAVFIDGCFWHGCPAHGRQSFKRNVDYWRTKIAMNVARDRETNSRLKSEGWTVLRYWEHEDADLVARDIVRIVRQAQLRPTKGPRSSLTRGLGMYPQPDRDLESD
ncbi:very short patch repair endonuclease [Nocardia bhagyanarayanae]|uniref:T/G mismatch-specific endonuclease n=1 Tax=Nocardia bhagyanarayanae TaxID=1215925 RepID=A0A543FC22_9NOCA|nr:very short patch repair endonuclease [Nocardia bhagyanarayanae]TQM31296.1 T/G mismatch-specific endonuclease [Nocardia bhagyanarayanae]